MADVIRLGVGLGSEAELPLILTLFVTAHGSHRDGTLAAPLVTQDPKAVSTKEKISRFNRLEFVGHFLSMLKTLNNSYAKPV